MLKRLACLLESLSGRASGVVVGFHGKRRRRCNQDGTTDPVAAVARQIADHLRPSHGVADQDDILQIQCIHDSCDVIGEGVKIVTAAGIIGTSMTAPVECHATPAPFGKAYYRDVPPVGAEPPWRHEDESASALCRGRTGPSFEPTVEQSGGQPVFPHLDLASAEHVAQHVLRVTFHPEGSRRWIVNWPEVERHLLSRAEVDLGSAADPVGAALLAEIRSYASASAAADSHSAPRPGDLLLPLHIRRGGIDLRLFSTIMTLCTPHDVTLQELRIETFFPADQESERCWQQNFGERAAPAPTTFVGTHHSSPW